MSRSLSIHDCSPRGKSRHCFPTAAVVGAAAVDVLDALAGVAAACVTAGGGVGDGGGGGGGGGGVGAAGVGAGSCVVVAGVSGSCLPPAPPPFIEPPPQPQHASPACSPLFGSV